MTLNPKLIRCVVFDYGFTLSSDLYFKLAPPAFPQWRAVIQRYVFDNQAVADAWMSGLLTTVDIAEIIAKHIKLPVPTIVDFMEKGCTDLSLNDAVWEFASIQRQQGRKTALVTGNFDVFSKVVVPAQKLQMVFDVILNSSDYHELNKDRLWPIAFELLGSGI